MKYSKETGTIDKSGLYYKESESEAESSSEDEDSGKEDLGLEENEDEEDMDQNQDEDYIDNEEEAENPLLVSMEPKTDKETRKERKANMWFDKDIFQGIDEDDDLEEADVQGAIEAITKKGGKVMSSKKVEDKQEQLKGEFILK